MQVRVVIKKKKTTPKLLVLTRLLIIEPNEYYAIVKYAAYA